jgi:hypothetical protein
MFTNVAPPPLSALSVLAIAAPLFSARKAVAALLCGRGGDSGGGDAAASAGMFCIVSAASRP